MDEHKKILLIDFCNYDDYPIGGYLTFERSLMQAFKSDLLLVGITTTKGDPVGKWHIKEIGGIKYDFFAIAYYDKSKTKHIIPDRLVIYTLLKLYRKKILQKNVRNVFIQRPEVLIAVKGFNYRNICFCSAGMENPLKISKFWYARFLSSLFDKLFFSHAANVQTFLAAGNEAAIDEFVQRSNSKVARHSIIPFPTRIDTNIFKPVNKRLARAALKLPCHQTIISYVGRLAEFKGWKFLIDCFDEFIKKNPNSLFYLIGEGEDTVQIREYIAEKKLLKKVELTGAKKPEEISLFLNSSDLFVMGSYKEGWSTTLLEAMACGVPVCTTDFSSAKEVILEGVSGYVESHSIHPFVIRMKDSLVLDRKKLPLKSEVRKYAVSGMKEDLLKYWKLV